MLKAIHAQESKEADREKAIQVAEKLRAMKLTKAAQKVEDGIEETLTYMDFPTQHWSGLITRLSEYYGAAEPPVRRGVSHLSGLTEPPVYSYSA